MTSELPRRASLHFPQHSNPTFFLLHSSSLPILLRFSTHALKVMSQNTSIQSYFPRTSVQCSHGTQELSSDPIQNPSSSATEIGLTPASKNWQQRTEYTEMDIEDLNPGPGCVSIIGRIVNFWEIPNASKSDIAAKGCFKLIVKDDTGAITVSTFLKSASS